ILSDVWIETYHLPPILEREPGRVRGLSGKQAVSLATCDSGSPCSANSGRSVSLALSIFSCTSAAYIQTAPVYIFPSEGRGSGSRQASKSCAVGFDSANWPPDCQNIRLLVGPPPFRCGLLASQLRSERSPRRSDSCRLIQYTSRGLPASPLGFEPKARRFDSCLVFHSTESLGRRADPRAECLIWRHNSYPAGVSPPGFICLAATAPRLSRATSLLGTVYYLTEDQRLYFCVPSTTNTSSGGFLHCNPRLVTVALL